MIVRSNRVVPEPKVGQRNFQLFSAFDTDVTESVFERLKKTFDPSVLPGAMFVRTLMSNTQRFQGGTAPPRGKHSLVVGAQGFGCTEVFDDSDEN